MLSRSLGVFASLALAANSVLLPPNVAVDGLGDDNALETLAINPFKATVPIECRDCPYAVQGHGSSLFWIHNREMPTTYLLDFEVGPNEDTLNLDGDQLYPTTILQGSEHLIPQFSVRQAVSEGSDTNAVRLLVTGYTFHYDSADAITEAGLVLLPMTLRINRLEYKDITPLVLTINILKDTDGRLMIASFDTHQEAASNPNEAQDKECGDFPFLCKWKSIFSDKVKGFKHGCGKYKGSLSETWKSHGKPPHHHGMGPPPFRHPHRPHHPHGFHHHSKAQRVFRGVFFTILVPILLGIFAGTLTYLIGMALGCAIAIVINKVRGERAYVSLPQDEESRDADEGGKDSEKEVYSEPPVYDAPPVYEEAVEKEVVDESK